MGRLAKKATMLKRRRSKLKMDASIPSSNHVQRGQDIEDDVVFYTEEPRAGKNGSVFEYMVNFVFISLDYIAEWYPRCLLVK